MGRERSPFPARFELLRPLGRGGGGEVWAARDRATGDEVAIKALHTGFHPSEAEALIRETTMLSGLEGLGFPKVLQLGRAADGRLFLIRELVQGESFDEVQRRDPRRALSLLYSAAAALTVVHRAGLLHGDIKPANLIVRPDGEVALVDLGLATALREGGDNTVGLTPHFAAPEVQAGGPLTVQAEIYSLGVVVRDLLADGADAELSEYSSEALDHLVERATHATPNRRFPSADEFAQALAAALGGDVTAFSPPGPPWPVRGFEATAYHFQKALDALGNGETLRVRANPGSGCSTLLRRASWAAALEGRSVAYIDEPAIAAGWAASEIEACARPGALLFIDGEIGELESALDAAAERGAQLVRVVTDERDTDFLIPALEMPVVVELLRGALPGMPEELMQRLVERVGAHPGALRQFVLAAGTSPVASLADIDRILSGSRLEEGPPDQVVEAYLDRGHYNLAASVLGELEPANPKSEWLRARYELAAGSPGESLRYTDQALALDPQERLRQRILATRSRAHLGLGSYQEALKTLEAVDEWEVEARTEGLSYRGLALTLLGETKPAQEALERAFDSAQESGSHRLKALVGSSLATAQWRAGLTEEAVKSYRAAIDAAREVGDSGMLASSQINLAGLMKECGDLAMSIELLEGAVDAATRAGRRTSVQQALLNLANTDLYLGRLERARTQIPRVGDPRELTPALRAQWHGLKAELFAREDDIEAALREFAECRQAWESLGRRTDAAEAALEAVLVAGSYAPEGERSSSRFVPSLRLLEGLLEHGRRLLESEENALFLLATARVEYFAGREQQAELTARRARQAAQAAGKREWDWRAAALEAQILDAAGKRTRAARVIQEAVEVLEEIGARLPQDLREVYWSEPRRRALRQAGAPESGRFVQAPRAITSHVDVATTGPGFVGGSGTDAVSRMTMTPLERRLARVLAINSDLAGEVDLERLATKIVGHACELLIAERGYLLLGRTSDELSVCAARGAQGEEHKAFSRSIAAEVLSSGQPLVSVDAGRDHRLQAFESVHLSAVSAVACVPILSPQGQPIGALYLETRSGARPRFGDEVPTLQAFADQAAIALENARLLAELRKKSADLEERNAHLLEARARLKEILGKRTARLREVRKELSSTRSQLASHANYGGMVGASEQMRKLYSLIDRVKDTDVPVLITGESGTGKEVAARAIHEGSARGKSKMLAVNCGAIPEAILESELFGHTRGAFTGADRDRKGLFREADGGVLFLDEIGETPMKMQASLLRVLQEGKVRAVGGAHEVPIDVRVIFATNRDLRAAVERGEFREDLLYRIQVVELELPPLRERTEDIPLLCDHFLQRFSVRFSQEKKSLSRGAMTRLRNYGFPGNIRQLENALLSAWVLSESDVIEEEDIQLPQERGDEPRASSRESTRSASTSQPASPSESTPAADGRPQAPSSYASSHHTSAHQSSQRMPRPAAKRGTLSEHQRGERRKIVEALENTGWNRVKAAELLDMPRRTFYRRLKDYNIQ